MTAKDSIVSALLSKAQSEINNIKKSHEFVKAVENEVNNIVKETNIETSYHNWLELNDKIYELETKILPELKAQRRILSEEIYLTLKRDPYDFTGANVKSNIQYLAEKRVMKNKENPLVAKIDALEQINYHKLELQFTLATTNIKYAQLLESILQQFGWKSDDLL